MNLEEMGIDPESMKTSEQSARESSAPEFFESHGREWRVGDAVTLMEEGRRSAADWTIKSFGKNLAVLEGADDRSAGRRRLVPLGEMGSIPDQETIRRITGT